RSVAYLEDPANFPGERGDAYKRVLALARLNKGDREGGARLLRELPPTPDVDDALIRLATTPEERARQVSTALARYEGSGLFRCWAALLALGRQRHAEAADGFFRALEFTRVKPVAEAGLWQSLSALAPSDPAGVQKRAAKMIEAA